MNTVELAEKAKLIAFARLLGVQGTDQEIFDKYWEYYQSAIQALSEQPAKGTVTVMSRPF